MNTALAAASAMALSDFSNDEIAALSNGIGGFGRISEGNISFKRAREAALVKESGLACDRESLEAALSLEINARMDRGEFS